MLKDRQRQGEMWEEEERQNDSSSHPPTSDALLFACILPPPSLHLFSHSSLPAFFLPHLMGAGTVTRGRLTGHLLGLREEDGGREIEVGWGKTERKSELL